MANNIGTVRVCGNGNWASKQTLALLASVGITSHRFDGRAGKDEMEIEVGKHCCKHGLGGQNISKEPHKK